MPKTQKFDAGDFLILEQHLSDRHAAGQQFQRTGFGGRLVFTACPPEKHTYRLDYIPKGMSREDYIAQTAAEGWTHCGKFNGWQCLRRTGGEAAAPDGTLLHNDLERGKWGRLRAEREALLGVAPMALFYFAGCLLKDTAYAGFMWTLATLFLVAAVAVVLPAYRVRTKCGQVMSQWYQEHAPAAKETSTD